MSYHQQLGQAFSPSAVRMGEMRRFIDSQRKAGKSDAAILAYLSAPTGLKRETHPCADTEGRNICAPSEIDAAMATAEMAVKAAPAPIAKPKSTNTKTLLMAGAAAIALWVLFRRKN